MPTSELRIKVNSTTISDFEVHFDSVLLDTSKEAKLY